MSQRRCSAIAWVVAMIHVSLYLVHGSQASRSQIVRQLSHVVSYPTGSKKLSVDAAQQLPSSPSGHYQGRRQMWSCRNQSLSPSSTKFYIKSLEIIMESPWVPQLKNILANMNYLNKNSTSVHSRHVTGPRRQVTVVFGDAKYALSLLNWLVSALVRTTPPLENTIVISIDTELQTLLRSKEITSVYVDPETITCGKIHRKISRVWIARCAVYQLLNHWGYDIMAYDSDAIVLKNLQSILADYSDSDVIGSAGFYPRDLGAKWGQTLCMGVVLFKSNRKTSKGA